MQFSEEKLHQLVEQKLRAQIEEARKNLDSENIAVPFVPYVGDNYAQAKHKILVVGKATHGWGWKDGQWNKEASLKDIEQNISEAQWYSELSKIPNEFIERKIIPHYSGCSGYYYSRFWKSIYQIAGVLLDMGTAEYCRSKQVAEHVFSSVAWTNLFKLTDRKGNPSSSLIKLQNPHNSLIEEIECLNPDIILFFTGPPYDKHLERVLPHIAEYYGPYNIKEIYGVTRELPAGQPKVALRTYHPQYYKFSIEEVTKFIQENLSHSK